MLAAFAELVQAGGAGPVADIGCGPGRLTAHLHSLGLTAFGLDLSPEMVAVARRAHPGLRFDEGSMTALDLSDGALRGIVAWYSIIHIPPEELPAAFAEFHRVLAHGGRLLVAFQVGDELLHLTEALGHAVSLDFYRWSPDRVSELLEQAAGRGRPAAAQARRDREGPPGTPPGPRTGQVVTVEQHARPCRRT